jgi:hypothetical protein
MTSDDLACCPCKRFSFAPKDGFNFCPYCGHSRVSTDDTRVGKALLDCWNQFGSFEAAGELAVSLCRDNRVETLEKQLEYLEAAWDRVFALIPDHGNDSHPELVNRVVKALRHPGLPGYSSDWVG